MKKPIKIEKLVKDLDNLYMKAWAEYLALHDEVKPLGNRQLNEEEWERATKILEEMEKKYKEEIHPIAHFITARLQFSTNAITSYHDFAETLNKGEVKTIIH
jgi:hypothetical protein